MAWIDWRLTLISELSKLRGNGAATDSSGAVLPIMVGTDMMCLLGMVSPGIVRQVTANNQLGNMVPIATSVNSDGSPNDDFNPLLAASTSCTVEAYVAGAGLDGAPWIRTVSSTPPTVDPSTGQVTISDKWDSSDPTRSFAPVADDGHIQQMSFVHQMMADWQRCIGVAVLALQNYALGNPGDDDVTAFWTALQALCSDLDVLQENPPSSFSDDVAGALKYALDKSAAAAGTVAGSVAAAAGNAAGTAASTFSSAFLGNASLLTLAVAGAAVYLFVIR